MDNLLKALMDKANLDEKTAEKVLDVVKDFIVDKLPEAASEPVLKALDGLEADDAMDMAKSVLGKFL